MKNREISAYISFFCYNSGTTEFFQCGLKNYGCADERVKVMIITLLGLDLWFSGFQAKLSVPDLLIFVARCHRRNTNGYIQNA